MAVGFLSIAVGDEQQAADRINTFLTGDIGWDVAQDVTNSASDRDIVFTSRGEPDAGNGFPRYIRIRGTGNAIVMHTYETFVDVGTNTGEVAEATYGLVTAPDDSRGFFLQVVADLERIVVHVETYAGTRYLGYAGRIKSYYTANQHNYPNLVKGSQSITYTWYYSAAERNAWMIAPEGGQAHYYAIEPINSTELNATGPNDRNGEVVLAAPVLVRDDVDPSKSELVGEPRGVYRMPRELAQHNTFVTVDGETYVVFDDLNAGMMAVGPVTVSGVGVPALYTDLTS